MGLLKTRTRTPAEEAERQLQIASEVQRQHEERLAQERELMHQNARRRQALWEQQDQDREDKRMAAMAREQQARRDREQAQREQQAKANQQAMAEYRDAKAEFDSVKRQLDALNVPHDLSTPEGLAAATEQKLKATALRELLVQTNRRLLRAERAVGIHRNGGF